MKTLSITTAWNETASFVKREAGLLFPIALGLVALPMAFLQAIMPQTPPGVEPEIGFWALFILPVAVITMIGQLTITILVLGREAVVRDALALAVRRFLPLLGATLIIFAGFVIGILVLAILVSFFVHSQVAMMAILTTLMLPLFLFLLPRLMSMTPVTAAETIGPVSILRRSWKLAEGNAWKLTGFLLITVIALVIVSLAVSSVGGVLIHLFAGTPERGNFAFFLVLLLGAILSMFYVTYFTTLIARIYAQLAG